MKLTITYFKGNDHEVNLEESIKASKGSFDQPFTAVELRDALVAESGNKISLTSVEGALEALSNGWGGKNDILVEQADGRFIRK